MFLRGTMGHKMQLALLTTVLLLPRVAAATVDGDQINRAFRIPLVISLGLMAVGGSLRLIAKLLQKLAGKADKDSSSS